MTLPTPGETGRFGQLEVESHHDGQTMLCRIDNAERLNALSKGVVDGFHALFDALDASTTVRVLIVTGAGRAFMAGGDLKELPLAADRTTRRYVQRAIVTYRRFLDSPQIIISAVNGIAFGGGAELALYSDLVVASRAARFGLPEAGIGLVPGLAVGRLASIVGPHRAKELMLATDSVDAEEAARLGFVNWVVEPGEEVSRALEVARTVLARSPISCEVVKTTVESTLSAEDFRTMHAGLLQVMPTTEARDAIAAFARKEKVDFGPPAE